MFTKASRQIVGLFFAICSATAAQAITLNNGDILVVGGSSLSTAIIRIDPTTGERNLVSGVLSPLLPVGSGPDFINLRGVTVDSSGAILVVDNAADALIRVDPATGNRVVVSGCGINSTCLPVGGGLDSFISPVGVRVEADGSILVMDDRGFDESTLFRVDPLNGDRTIVSSKTIGSDAPNGINSGFGLAGTIEVEQDNNILVFSRQYFILYRVDPVSGDRTVVSRSSELVGPSGVIGDGADFGGTIALDLTDNGDILAFAAAVGGSFATNPVRGVIRADPVSGDRTLVSGCNSKFPFGPSDCVSVVGAGDLFQVGRGMAREPDGNIIVSDRNLGIVRVNSITGDRTIISPNFSPPFPLSFLSAVAIVTGLGSPPQANAGPDRTIDCASPAGAMVTLDGSGSFDPDGDPLTYAWSNSFGMASGVSPTVDLPPGHHQITLIVNDGQANSDPDTVTVNVDAVDATPPGIVAGLELIGAGDEDGDSDERHFRASFSAFDTCDPLPSVTAALNITDCPRVSVANGQIFEFAFEDEDCEVELENGILEIEASELRLTVTATDASGNSSLADVQANGGNRDNDDDTFADGD